MKRKVISRILLVVAILAIVVTGIKITPVVTEGYKMYKEAVEKTSLQAAVEAVKSDTDYITIDQISHSFLEEVIESEDRRFYSHGGIDLFSTARAIVRNIQAGRLVEGGSTITQQLAKNLYFSFEKKYERKVAELFVAIDIEKMFSKEEILELYCNIAYFGEGCYGLKEAANHYYGVEAADLSNEQADALVWTLKSPNYYNPNVYVGAAL